MPLNSSSLRKLLLGTTAFVAASLCVSGSVRALDIRWLGPTGGLWSNAANWNAGLPTNLDVAVFPSAPGARVVDVDGPQSVNGLSFESNLNRTHTLINGTIELTGGAVIVAPLSFVNFDASLSLNLSADTLFNIAAPTSIAGTIYGSGGLTKSGTGTLTLTGANSYSGATVVSQGTLSAGAANTLSATSDITVQSGATLEVTGDQLTGSLAGAGNVSIGPGAIFTTGLNEIATTFSGSFSGAGSLEVDGNATELTLTGNSIIGGDLTVCCSLLDIRGSFTAAGTAAVLDGNLNVSGPSGALTADVVAVEGGNINILGGGRVATNILGSIGGEINVSGSGSVVNAELTDISALAGDATLNISNGGRVVTRTDAALSSVVLGTGSATVRDAGSEWRVGGNLIVGDTISGFATPGLLTVRDGGRVSAGTLTIGEQGTVRVGIGNVGGTVSAGSVVNAGVLAFNHNDSVTFAAPLSGSGAVTKEGSGTLTFTGANTSTGGSTITDGTLVGSAASLGRGTIRNDARLIIDQPTGAAFDTAINGTGTLVKRGAGKLDLRGTHALSGSTQVQAGNLAVNGSLAQSAVTVASAGTLSGTGVVGSILAQSGGTVSPGNSIGTLNVAGNVGFSSGSTYRVEVNAQGQSDRIAATGVATLSGGKVFVPADQGSYSDKTDYTILTAASGVNGTFAVADTNFAFLTPTLSYDGASVTLTLKRKVIPPKPVPFTSVAISKNQYDTAAAVEARGSGNRLYDTVLGASTGAARQAFDALSGEVHASAVTVAYQDATLISDRLLQRLDRASQSGSSTVPAAYAADRPGRVDEPAPIAVQGFDPRRFAFWGEGLGSWGRTRFDGNAASIDRSTGGFVLGADMAVSPAYRLGVAGGFTRTTFDIDARNSSGTTESVFGAIYGSAQWGAIGVRLGAAYAGRDTDTKRSVIFPAFSDHATASYDGSTAQVFGEIGYAIPTAGARLEPFIGASIIQVRTDDFRENGGIAALAGYGPARELGSTTVGIKAETTLGEAAALTLRGTFGWRHAYGDIAPSSLVAFDGGAVPFTVWGIPVDRDALIAQAGLDWQATQDVTLGIAYNGQIGQRGQDHTLNGNLTWRF